MKPDLRRWNRAGLKRFRYVNGNAATYLETLRQELFSRLSGWDAELLGIQPDNDTPEGRAKKLEEYINQFGEDHQRALDNYLSLNDKRGSIALEIIRSFARATHVLTEHLDAYANEGYLGTATQWENVRRLIYGLDHHPRPPASAMTHLVLHAKPEQDGLVARGLQIKHTPEDGSPVVFETLEEIEVEPAFNAVRLKDWNRSQDAFKLSGQRLKLDRLVEGLKHNEPVIVENNSTGLLLPCLLKNAGVEDACTWLELTFPSGLPTGNWGLCSDVHIHLKPAERLEVFAPLKAQITQEGTTRLFLEEEPSELKKGEYIFIGKEGTGIYREIWEVNGREIVLASPVTSEVLPADFYIGMPEKFEVQKGEDGFQIDGDMTRVKKGADILILEKEGGVESRVLSAEFEHNSFQPGDAILRTLLKIELRQTATPKTASPVGTRETVQILLPPGVNQWRWKIDRFIDMSGKFLQVDTIKRMARKELCVAACGSSLMAARVQNITEEGAGRSGLQVDDWQPEKLSAESKNFLRSQTTVFGKFKEQARLYEWDSNKAEVSGNGSPENPLLLDDTKVAEKLRPGRLLVIEHETPQERKSFQTSVLRADGKEGRLFLEPTLPKGYVSCSTVIRANVVLAGHGETQPEKILGSGNATLSNQEFLFPVSNVSFVADATQISGVRAGIQVIVDGETWMQVSSFNPSKAADPHYVVRMTEEGQLRIIFGDGVHGRRLPTGENNVRIAWRMGAGAEGNLEAGLLKKPAHPHPRVEAISQPFRCEGGNDMESVTSLRRSAPASLLTMSRAVSVNDFAQLAESHPSVWSARAKMKSSGRAQRVCVTVVLAEGQALVEGALKKALEAFLLSHAIPGVRVELKSFHPRILKLDISLYINSARFDPEVVKAEVRKALLQRFALKNRTINAPVYLSDIYQCVEAARGVEYSVCKFKGEEKEQVLRPEREDEVIYMDDETCITLEEKEPEK